MKKILYGVAVLIFLAGFVTGFLFGDNHGDPMKTAASSESCWMELTGECLGNFSDCTMVVLKLRDDLRACRAGKVISFQSGLSCEEN